MSYPKYLIKERLPSGEWKMRYLPLAESGAAYDNGWCEVDIGDSVLLDDKGNIRPATSADYQAVSRAADDYSCSK